MVLFYEGYCYLQCWGCSIFINDDLIFNSTGICNWLCLNWRAESLLFNIYLLFIFLVLQNCWKQCQKSFLRPLRRIALRCVVVSCGAGWGSCRISNTCTHKLNIRINGVNTELLFLKENSHYPSCQQIYSSVQEDTLRRWSATGTWHQAYLVVSWFHWDHNISLHVREGEG